MEFKGERMTAKLKVKHICRTCKFARWDKRHAWTEGICMLTHSSVRMDLEAECGAWQKGDWKKTYGDMEGERAWKLVDEYREQFGGYGNILSSRKKVKEMNRMWYDIASKEIERLKKEGVERPYKVIDCSKIDRLLKEKMDSRRMGCKELRESEKDDDG